MPTVLYIIAGALLWIAGAIALGWMVECIKGTGNVLFIDEEIVKNDPNRSNDHEEIT